MTKVEEVARAIAGCQTELGADRWRYCLPEARAAIEAMREPNDQMVSAGDDWMPQFNPPSDEPMLSGHDVVSDVFRAMINAALSE